MGDRVEYIPERGTKRGFGLSKFRFGRISIPTNEDVVCFIRKKESTRTLELLLKEELSQFSQLSSIQTEPSVFHPLHLSDFPALEAEIYHSTEQVTGIMPALKYGIYENALSAHVAQGYEILQKHLEGGTRKTVWDELGKLRKQIGSGRMWADGITRRPIKNTPQVIDIGLANRFSTADTLSHELGHAAQNKAYESLAYSGDYTCWYEGHADIVRGAVMKQKAAETGDSRYLWEKCAWNILKLREGLKFARSKRRFKEWYEPAWGDMHIVGNAAIAVVARDYGASFVRDTLRKGLSIN